MEKFATYICASITDEFCWEVGNSRLEQETSGRSQGSLEVI